ncbi:MAG TPA: VCBS repeat-containing protein [Thermoanaerobaculia bacterium]|nr:VCBS repeat-containing protein [Thermoanaerobaculia bacterium]
MSKRVLLIVLGLFLAAAAAVAETPKQKKVTPPAAAEVDGGTPAWIRPETPEQRMTRLGTTEDPGPDPDPEKHFMRFGRSFHIEKYERWLAAYDTDPGTVRPDSRVNFAFELYHHNEKWVWIWMPDADHAAVIAENTTAPERRVSPYENKPLTIDYFSRIRSQFTDLTPPPANRKVRFAASSAGLPNRGSWRNSLAVADMNGDGFLDLIAPPERGAGTTALPAIFLGDGKGNWRYWEGVEWPHMLDYGGVAAADFNKDGHMDLAFAVHLSGVFVFLGNGKGKFTAVEEGIARDFGSRRVVATDVDRDGYPDLVLIFEGPSASQPKVLRPKVFALLNRKKGRAWEQVDITDTATLVGGDWLSAADLNGDLVPDFVTASVFWNSWNIVHLSEGTAKWAPVKSDGDLIPSRSYYFASTAGNFTSKKRQDAILTYVRYWPRDLEERILPKPPLMETTNIDRLTVGADGKVQRHAIMRWAGSDGLWGIANGDFDGDGNTDIIFARKTPREMGLLLGDGKGGFTLAEIEGLPLAPNISYDIRVADVNKDRKPDVIMMYESAATTAFGPRDGSIQVFLNRGTVAPAEAVTAAAVE